VPLQIVLKVGERLERCRAIAAGEAGVESVGAEEVVHRPDRGQRQHVRLEPAQGVPGRKIEHVVGDLVGGVELGARDRMKRGEVGLGRGALRGVIFVGNPVAEPVGVAQVAAEDGVERIALEARLVAGLEQLEQTVMRALLGNHGRRDLGGDWRRARRRRRDRGAGAKRGQRYRDDQPAGENRHSRNTFG
jgi:hypothetical protein